MKRSITVLSCVLFALMALLPLGKAVSLCFGCSFTPLSVQAFSIAIAVLSVCVVALDIIYNNTITNTVICAMMTTITPLSLINIFLNLLERGRVSVLVSGAVCCVCCCILTVKHAKPLVLKIVALVLSVLLALPVGFLSLFVVFFPIGQNTVVQCLESPNGRYYAEVIDSDQGALGGDTIVNVYEKWEINLLLFKLEKKPQPVYFGEWGEFKNMEIYWKDDRCIVINSIEYEVE